MQNTNALDKTKLILFNPFVLVLLFISLFISLMFGYHSTAGSLFLLIVAYPVLCKIAFASWGERLFFLIVLMIFASVIFG